MFFFVTGPRMLDMTHCAEHVMCYLPTFAMYSGARGVRLCRALVESSRITLKMQKNKKKKKEKYVQEETPVHNQIKTPEILKNTVFSVNLTLPLLKKKKNSQQNNPADQTDSLQLAFSYMNRIYC